MSKIEQFWQDATADDVARVMAGETVEARFRDDEGGKWLESDHSLGGYDSTEEFCKWISSTGCPWRFCQVYREPSWYANKPDPGPGWRLLEKFPSEPKLATDDAWDCHSKEWKQTFTDDGDQVKTVWYRRRIEQLLSGHRWLANGDRLESGDLYYEKGALLEVSHEYWGNNVMLTEAFMRKIEQPKPEPQHFVLRVGDSASLPNGQTITITAKGYEVTQ